jgi:hypothetical protein
VVHEELLVTPADLAAGCSPAPGHVVVQAQTHLACGHRARLVVTTGEAGPFQLTGTVTAATPAEGRVSVELEIDADQRATLQRILDWTAGKAPRPRPRERRYRLALPAFVTWPAGNAYMTTASLSTGGCGLAWSGAPPAVGHRALVRLGSGNGSATFLARVCWVRDDPRGTRAGVRFVSGDVAALTSLLLQHGRRELYT